MKNDALPAPQVEYRIKPVELPLFDFTFDQETRRQIDNKRKMFRRVLRNVYSAFKYTRDGRIVEDRFETMGKPYAEVMSPRMAQLLFEVWCALPLSCEPCRRLVLKEGRCIECRVRLPSARDRAALVRKLETHEKDLDDSGFAMWHAERIKRADNKQYQSKVLYDDYRQWLRTRRLTRPEKRIMRSIFLSHRRFGQLMLACGYRRVRNGRGIFYVGLRLRKPSSEIVAFNSENA